MRVLAALLLTGLLSVCPLLCGAAEFGHGAHRHGTPDGASRDSSVPDQCPEEGDNCICQGAVPAVDVRVPFFDAQGLPSPLAVLAHTPLHPLAHLTWRGAPTGLAGWGDALAVRSFLQNYRC